MHCLRQITAHRSTALSLLVCRIQWLVLTIVQRLLPLLRIRLLRVMLHVVLALCAFLRCSCAVLLGVTDGIR
jgi:hypothetical protein